jgi:hypothetical protein
VEDGIGRELMHLHAINEKKPTEKFVGRERKTVEKEGKKHHPKALRRARDNLITGKSILHGLQEESGFLGLVQITLGDGGRGPANIRSLLGRVLHHQALHSNTNRKARSIGSQQWQTVRSNVSKEEEEVAAAGKRRQGKQ